MPAAHDEGPDHGATAPARDDAAREPVVHRGTGTAPTNIDRVAAKVEGLLRPDS